MRSDDLEAQILVLIERGLACFQRDFPGIECRKCFVFLIDVVGAGVGIGRSDRRDWLIGKQATRL